jgi:hypothetical protein
LVTSLLAYLPKAVPAQHPNDIFGTANRKALAHLSATSSTFAPAGNVPGVGSNQRSSASLAFRTASSSVSPAEAHPGNSGKNAAHRLVCGSCSTTSRSFMGERITPRGFAGKPQMSDEPRQQIEIRRLFVSRHLPLRSTAQTNAGWEVRDIGNHGNGASRLAFTDNRG